MPDRFWVGGNSSWDATAGTKWAATSGGAGGQSVPTSADDVFFDGASGAVTVTVSASANCRNLIFTGFTGTFAGSQTITVYGPALTLSASMAWTHSNTVAFLSNCTITSNGKAISSPVQAFSGGAILLADAFSTTGAITVAQGTFTTNNFNVTAASLSSSNSNTRTINLGSSTVTLNGSTGTLVDFTTSTGLTFNSGTSTIIFAAESAFINVGLTAITFYNVQFAAPTSTGAARGFLGNGPATFNNIVVTGSVVASSTGCSFSCRCTINGTLSTTGTTGNRRVWFRANTYGIAQTLTINSAPSLTDADFRDIYVIGTAAPISGTRIGNLRGCRGITFSTPKTVYWNLAAGGNWSANAWAASSGGGVSTDNFPLAQDTAVIENTGLNTSATVTLDAVIRTIGTVDMSARTNAMTISNSNPNDVYGNWINGSGTTTAGGSILNFSGRNTQTITSAGKSFIPSVTIDSYGGTVELADALNIGANTLTVTNGTFDTKNFNVTAGSLSSNNSNVRAITLGSSTVTLSTIGNSVVISTSINLTFNAGTSTIVLQGISTTALVGAVIGPSISFYNVSFIPVTTTATMAPTITGVNVFNNLLYTAHTAASVISAIISGNQTINGTLTVAGATAVRRIFVRSDTFGTTRTLTVNSLSATDCDFRDITIAGAAAGSSPTRAGDCGGNTGITFPAPKTVYWNLAGAQNWSATAWAPGSGGTPDINNFPLAQDTAVFDNAGAAGTISINFEWNIGTFDASLRTSAMTFTSGGRNPLIYGDWKFGSGVTSANNAGLFTFQKRGTQTITSNGVTFGSPITVDCITGTVQLADAFILGSALTLTLTSGTFDAVTYNVTIGNFIANASGTTFRTLKMGTGTWTLSGTGSNTWNLGSGTNFIFYKGAANIVLSDTSASSRSFAGASLSYNKLTIGGATGTSTTTIDGSNRFTELASTKTVAHTIALGATQQFFGAWTVTGTAGNVVTLTGTGINHVIVGACTSGIDYLAMGSIGFSAGSRGEFYAGDNSTGTAAAPVYRTAKPADSTRYWVGGTGNWSDTARWSTSSGGSGGASVPRSHDDVVFDSLSNATAYTATVNAVTGGIRTKALTVAGPLTGNLTLAGSTIIFGVHGNVTLPATGLTRTYTGLIVLSGSSTGRTFTTNGVTLAGELFVDGVGCGWSLGSALSIGSFNLTVASGTIDFAGYAFTCGGVSSDNGNSRTIDLDVSTITYSGNIEFGTTETSRANLTFTAGTAQINCSATSPTFNGNNQTFHNVAFTSTSTGTVTLNGANTFNNLSVTGITSAGLKNVSLTANQTINGTLTLSAGANSTMRTFLQSDTIGTTRTLTCAAFSGTDADFRDITIAGAAAPVSGTRLGNCRGNSGITFDAAKTVYWNSSNVTWGSSSWAAVLGGTPSNGSFPLAQDTAIIPATSPASGNTITIDAAYNIGTIDMSARTSNTMTLATGTTAPAIYGNWINGTGTTLSGTGAITFAGRGSQTITSAGRTFTQDFVLNNPSGTVTLQDAFVSSNGFNLTAGAYSLNNYNHTSNNANVSNSNVRSVAFGTGTWTVPSTAGWTATTSTNLTVTGTGTISLTSASAKTFAGGDASYLGITLNQGGAGTLTITGNNTFANISNTFKATGATTIALGTTTQRVGNFTASGEAGRVLTVTGTSASSPATLVLTGGTVTTPDYLTVTGVRAYNLTDTWYAGANSTNNGSLGWIFAAGTVVVSFFGNFFAFF